ncbi:hypothetical protein D3C71_1764030 [compost metagenome]
MLCSARRGFTIDGLCVTDSAGIAINRSQIDVLEFLTCDILPPNIRGPLKQLTYLFELHPLRAKLSDHDLNPVHGFFFPVIFFCSVFTVSR